MQGMVQRRCTEDAQSVFSICSFTGIIAALIIAGALGGGIPGCIPWERAANVAAGSQFGAAPQVGAVLPGHLIAQAGHRPEAPHRGDTGDREGLQRHQHCSAHSGCIAAVASGGRNDPGKVASGVRSTVSHRDELCVWGNGQIGTGVRSGALGSLGGLQ